MGKLEFYTIWLIGTGNISSYILLCEVHSSVIIPRRRPRPCRRSRPSTTDGPTAPLPSSSFRESMLAFLEVDVGSHPPSHRLEPNLLPSA